MIHGTPSHSYIWCNVILRLAEDIPGASLTVIPKAGHFLMEDAPDAVAESVIRFVQGAGG